ncbi:MAG TPA: acyl-CoA dehydrogenase family protein [Jatrophihabitantaceae bacterium]
MTGPETSASAAETDELRRVVREFAAETFPSSELRATDYSASAWTALSSSLGLTGIGIPQRHGGAGYSFTELGVVVEELGAALAPVPFLSTVCAAAAIVAGGDEAAQAELLPELASGATVGVPVLRGAVAAHRAAAGWTLDGLVPHVPDGARAALFVVAANAAEGPALFAARVPERGVTVRPRNALDATRPLAAVEFAAAPARFIGIGPSALQLAADLQLAALACEQIGGTARCLDRTVDYVKTRVQFGVPIGSFQAVKHRCADLLVELEAARSIAYHARDAVAAAFAGADAGSHAAVAAAAAWCAQTYVHAAQETIQLHGGIGFTWEHDAHLHLRRARSDQLLYGTPREHRRELVVATGLAG